MAGDERVPLSLRNPHHGPARVLAQVIGLDEHVVFHQPADEVPAEAREPLGVALPVRLVRASTGLALEGLARLLLLHRADELAGGAALERSAAEGVIDPVRDEHAAKAHPPQLTEAAVDIRFGALRRSLELAAAERIRGLHSDHHGELAALDDPTRLRRVGHDSEPTTAATAGLRIDVALQGAQAPDLELDRL